VIGGKSSGPKAPPKTHYDTLRVSREAPIEVIRAAYRALVQLNHPDRRPDDPQAMQAMVEINAAFDLLSDEKRRAAYDSVIARLEGRVRPATAKSAAAPVTSPGASASSASEARVKAVRARRRERTRVDREGVAPDAERRPWHRHALVAVLVVGAVTALVVALLWVRAQWHADLRVDLGPDGAAARRAVRGDQPFLQDPALPHPELPGAPGDAPDAFMRDPMASDGSLEATAGATTSAPAATAAPAPRAKRRPPPAAEGGSSAAGDAPVGAPAAAPSAPGTAATSNDADPSR
jgi:hypothetical protein